MAKRIKDVLVQNGMDEDQAELVAEAIALSRTTNRRFSTEIPALRSVRRTFFATSDTTGKDFRRYHELIAQEIQGLTPQEVAFGDMPDQTREEFSAFCWSMYSGHQEIYLDRHEDEDPAEFLNRPQKRTLNVTKLVINTLSKLYHKPPTRKHKSEKQPGPDGQEIEVYDSPPEDRDLLDEIWSGELFNRSMQEVDRRTRLVGTVAVRPMWDPDQPGGIRLWVYMSHQLRVIPDPVTPWKPAAVIERIHPFGREPSIVIWTDTWFVDLRKRREVTVERHGLGRIPHVFCRDELSYTSFFVEGRGRVLCSPNAILNNDLSDLEEIKQMQGFSLLELVNPINDKQRVGPRETATFRPPDNTTPFGARFVSPNAPLGELRADLAQQIEQILNMNGVPVAALGAEINRRTLSGAAIRAAMQPIISDNKERESIFKPFEHDLADSMLRIVSRHNGGYVYDPANRPQFTIFYQPMEFPLDTRDQVVKDDFEIAQGITTPAAIIRRESPEEFPTHEDAVEQWQENLEEQRLAGFTPGDEEPNLDLRASYGDLRPTVEGREEREYGLAEFLDDVDATTPQPSRSTNPPPADPARPQDRPPRPAPVAQSE